MSRQKSTKFNFQCQFTKIRSKHNKNTLLSLLRIFMKQMLLFLSANVIPFEIGVRLGQGATAIGDGFDLIYNQVPCQGA